MKTGIFLYEIRVVSAFETEGTGEFIAGQMEAKG